MDWRSRAGTSFICEKTAVTASRGMAVTNHPLASAAAVEMMAAGGNAVDAAIAALFTLTVVEPMMVGIFGGGAALIRLADGREVVLDGLSTAPAAARADSFTPISDTWPDYMEAKGRANRVGPKAVAVPGTLKAWCEAAEQFGRLPLSDLIAPAIRHAERGFHLSSYLATCIAEIAPDLALDAAIAAVFLPNGRPLGAGDLLIQKDYANTLRLIAEEGPEVLYGGELGRRVADYLAGSGSFLRFEDLERYRTVTREPVRGTYRGFEIVGPPPPCAGGVHTLQILNLLEAYNIADSGFGTRETLHLVLEALKIAAADRRAVTADPAFVDVPVERLISKAYADQRRMEIDLAQASTFEARIRSNESANTTHVTVADAEGNIVTSTQTINSLFGARIIIPGTGIIPNNYMYLFDPHPGNALSLEPGKRITSGITALIGKKEGRPVFALGLPGAHRIPASAMQAVLNLIDHGMDVQEAVEAPRVFTWGQEVEIETSVPVEIRDMLGTMGHRVVGVDHVAGGMCAIGFSDDGRMTGAACWRADGVPMGLGGGSARAGTSFWPDPRRGRVY
ncbi:gamma-glutamyltranspeptidase/glutathione hydrolase [Azorhizobium sp. AG788]|uniref:gamma-glutamyltransferase n=1 Tax=Azorhizobium sp. AG788 TaxID=2183897 RepID=UPI0010DAA317|nr:gamma-glutamyltransferase [Azorhizobium sp. AG788]TDT94946.1 gamma-glutamyltranspeptidase/glutathione hydrolase [Azorhizobium sp. AG788]